MKKRLLVLILVLGLLGLMAGCDNTTTGTSVGGAELIFGTERDDKTLEIKNPGTTFKAGEAFYYVLKNNEAFGSDKLTIRLENAATGENMLEQSYDVTADNSLYSNTVGFNNPGKYRVLLIIDGKTRAQQEVIIE